jgi:hypothetical protein
MPETTTYDLDYNSSTQQTGPVPVAHVYTYNGKYQPRLRNDEGSQGSTAKTRPLRFPDNVTPASVSPPASTLCETILSAADMTRSFNDTLSGKTLDSGQGLSYTTAAELVSWDPLIWRVVSVGTKSLGGAPVALHAVAYTVRKDSPNVNPPGALAVGGTLRIGGNAQISSDTDGKYGAIAENAINVQGANATITNTADPNDAQLPNIGDGNLPDFWRIFFEEEYSKSKYNGLTNDQKDALALDKYRDMSTELTTDAVPTDGTGGTKGYKGLYFINMGNSASARYQGGNALVSGDNGNDVAVLVIVNNGGMMCQRSGDYLANSNVLVNVNGANFKGFVYVVGEYDMQGNSTITGAVISTGNQTVDILGTGQGNSKIFYKQSVVDELKNLSKYFKVKGSFADIGLLQ